MVALSARGLAKEVVPLAFLETNCMDFHEAVVAKGGLHEDNLAAGYDKVSEGFGTSAVHMVCYQEEAALALAHALPPGVIDVE